MTTDDFESILGGMLAGYSMTVPENVFRRAFAREHNACVSGVLFAQLHGCSFENDAEQRFVRFEKISEPQNDGV